MSRVTDYIRDTRGELKHVSWPTRTQALLFTVLVIVLSLLVAAYMGGLDYLFSQALEIIVF